MQVILTKEVPNLGSAGDLVAVRDGHFINFLLPRGMAVAASVGNRRQLEHQKREAAFQREKVRKESASVAGKLKGMTVKVARKAGEQGKLFGSVTSQDIAKALADDHQVTVDRRKIDLGDPIRKLGETEVGVKLSGDVEAIIKVEVVAEAE